MSKITDEDLAVCESERLQWTGTIQANGALVVTDEHHKIFHHSANFHDFFKYDDNVKFSELFQDKVDYFHYREKEVYKDSHHLIANVTTNLGVEGDLIKSQHAYWIYYEFEPKITPTLPSSDVVTKASVKMLPHDFEIDIENLLRSIYQFTGYQKIMLYRFLEDETGEVTAELNDSHLDNYLGLRFPASDVPRIARALYAENPYRIIFDIAGETSKMVSLFETNPEVDLTPTSLRSVSPVHLEYLKNMGVRSSASFSINVKGKLWGLIALHATARKTISVQNRIEVRHLINTLEQALLSRNIKENYKRFNASAALIEGLVNSLIAITEAGQQIGPINNEVEQLIECDHLVILISGKIAFQSSELNDCYIDALCKYARKNTRFGQFSTSTLVNKIDQGKEFRQQVSGIIYECTDSSEGQCPQIELLWLRKEDAVNVQWAGEPVKIRHEEDGNVKISPRQSFQKWSMISEGIAKPWTSTDLHLASKILSLLVSRLNAV